MNYERLNGDRMRETNESIRKRVQATRNIQQQRYASSQPNIISGAEMHVGKMQQFMICKPKVIV
jgi:predicted ATPase with chaperone activity